MMTAGVVNSVIAGCLSALCLLVAAPAPAATPSRSALATPTVLTPQEAAQRAMLPDASLVERELAYENVDHMSPAERQTALLLMVNGSYGPIAERAAMRLVLDNIGDPQLVAQAIGAHIDEWSDQGQSGVLMFMAQKVQPPEPFVALARAYLSRAQASGKNLRIEGRLSGAEVAAVMLALDGSADDAQQIRAALRRAPRSAALWLAAAGSGPLEDADVQLARSVYRDASAGGGLRVAAAIAAAGADAEANAMVGARLEQMFGELGDKDEAALYANARSTEQLLDVERRVAVQVEPLPALRFLPNDPSLASTRRALQALNEFIRTGGGVVAALRWPDVLLERRPPHMNDTEYERLLAILVLRHPDKLTAAQGALGRPLSSEAQERARVAGLGGFGRTGTLVNGL